jgi:hypothetical protein
MANGRGLNENHCQFWQRNTTLGFVTRIEKWKFAVAGVGRRNQNLFKYSHIARCGIVLWLSGGPRHCVVIVGRSVVLCCDCREVRGIVLWLSEGPWYCVVILGRSVVLCCDSWEVRGIVLWLLGGPWYCVVIVGRSVVLCCDCQEVRGIVLWLSGGPIEYMQDSYYVLLLYWGKG